MRYRNSSKKDTDKFNPSHINSNNTISSISSTKKPQIKTVN